MPVKINSQFCIFMSILIAVVCALSLSIYYIFDDLAYKTTELPPPVKKVHEFKRCTCDRSLWCLDDQDVIIFNMAMSQYNDGYAEDEVNSVW